MNLGMLIEPNLLFYVINTSMQRNLNEEVVIIGGGPAGYKCAIELKKISPSLKLSLIEKQKLGGTCLHSGCIPSKLLHSVKNLSEFPTLLQKNQVILEKAIQSEMKNYGVNIITGTASIDTANQMVIVDMQTKINYSQLIIATGSKPKKIAQFPNSISSDDFFNIDKLKQGLADSFTIIGGGYIGIELASMLAKHGKKVQIFEAQKQILSFLDHDIQNRLLQELTRQGISIYTDVNNLANISINQQDTIISAIGRETQLPEGIDKNNLPSNIHIIGDASEKFRLAHYAYMQARQLAHKLLDQNFKFREDLIPLVVFSHPELASLGITENSAREIYQDSEIKTIMINWASNAKARIIGAERGFTKLVYLKSSGRILGAHLIGQSATDLISVMIPILQQDLSLEDMKTWIFPHPTLGEIFAI
ncbi:MAG: hypothetical protein RLZZ361_1571 [Cyanobacteriota bacterium]|jgi:dihydrolipoamide dehydrogenase